MRKTATVLTAIVVSAMALACDLTALLPNPTPVVVVVTATSQATSVPTSTTVVRLDATLARPTATRVAAAATKTPRPTLPPGPTPKLGTGNVTGRILWNGKGVANLDVKLCESILLLGGCSGKQYPSRTDATGTFLFTDIPPRKYSLAIHALEKESWLYIASLGIARTYTVTADNTLNLGDQDIYKSDLGGAQPTDESKVNIAKPILIWDKYPNVAYYKVYLNPEHGKTIFSYKQIDSNQIASDTPLVNCKYTWRVDAYNADGIKIAQFSTYSHFYVVDQPVSCYVVLTGPTDNSKTPGTSVELTWEAHPEADYYTVYMYTTQAGQTKRMLDYLQVREINYRFAETLEPGRYYWSVSAYDQFGTKIAGSSTIDFTVE